VTLWSLLSYGLIPNAFPDVGRTVLQQYRCSALDEALGLYLEATIGIFS